MTYFDDHARMFARAAVETYVVENAGHALFAERPEVAIDRVRRFFDGITDE